MDLLRWVGASFRNLGVQGLSMGSSGLEKKRIIESALWEARFMRRRTTTGMKTVRNHLARDPLSMSSSFS